MPQRRIPIAPGIFRQGDRIVAIAKIGNSRDGNQPRDRKTFPLGYSVEKIKAWRHGAIEDLLLASPAPAESGTLAADVDRFVAKLPNVGRYRSDSVSILKAWQVSPLGTTPTPLIERADVVDQLDRWAESGVAVGTRNRRLSRLRVMFRRLYNDAPNPTDKIRFQREPESEPRDIPIHIVRLIVDSLADVGRAAKGETRPEVSETKIRLRVMAWTGIPGATLRRVTSRHLDLDNARVYVTFRRKGQGSHAAWIALLPDGVAALRDFQAAGLIGKSWNRSSMRKTFHRGIARAKVVAQRHADETGDKTWLTDLANLPPHCKPYDLRHSFAAEMYRQTSDIRAVAALLQHADLETTKRYTAGAVSDRVAAAIAKASSAFTNAPTLPTTPAAAAAPASTPAAKPALRLVRKRIAS
jgi:integrase